MLTVCLHIQIVCFQEYARYSQVSLLYLEAETPPAPSPLQGPTPLPGGYLKKKKRKRFFPKNSSKSPLTLWTQALQLGGLPLARGVQVRSSPRTSGRCPKATPGHEVSPGEVFILCLENLSVPHP